MLARRLRSRIETLVPAGYGRLAAWAGRMRDRVKSTIPDENLRRHFWESLIDGPVAEQVLVLNGLGAKPGPNRVVASIYKHVALWPGYLSLTWAQFVAMHNDGSLLRLIEQTQGLARRHAAYVAAELGPRPPGLVADAVQVAVSEFTDTVIARMIPIGQMMRAALGD